MPRSSNVGIYKPIPLVGLSKPAIFLQAILHVVVTEVLAGFPMLEMGRQRIHAIALTCLEYY